ncbi:hypothetical protein M3201_13605 [Paenibacillus motobuensis]|uniref:hypothetical protein n=1 Tax=Paenibacillus TaxID=44249 RepID=UPI002040CA93|nr:MULTISPECIES: hypothetical protein [Paenibacillus]MCM3040734.1 hypothetical protein [Paenibacillus lutimineralis]MCM3647838.1 hypothetical protein [Paenibacillus motobuensis]
MSQIVIYPLNAIRRKLLESVPELKAVYNVSEQVEKSSAKPYVILSPTKDSGSSSWTGLRYPIEVSLYVDKTSPEQLKSIAESIIETLNNQLLEDELNDKWLTLYPQQSVADAIDEGQQAIKRTMIFTAICPRPLTAESQVTSDEWLNAIAAWTRELLGQEWSIYSGAWPLQPSVPAVMWRVSEMGITPKGTSSFEIQKRLTAFIQGVDSDQEHAALLQLLEALGTSTRLPLNQADRRYLTVSEPKVNPKVTANGYTNQGEGPLTVTLSGRTNRQPAGTEGPLMQFVHYEPNLR